MPKTLCPSCDRPVTPDAPGKPCRNCATLAKFDGLVDVDFRGNGSIGYSTYAAFYFEPFREAPANPRFLCVRDFEVIGSDEVDASGVQVIGHDRFGSWFGTDLAPCIVRGDAETAIVHLMGRRFGKPWDGWYLGCRKSALLAMPEDVELQFIEIRPAPAP